MVKKFIAVLLLICLCTPIFATLDMSKAEPYSDSEFPKWALDIRRSEVIFAGAMPISFIATSAIANAVNPGMTFTNQLLISAGISAAITIADIVIGILNEN